MRLAKTVAGSARRSEPTIALRMPPPGGLPGGESVGVCVIISRESEDAPFTITSPKIITRLPRTMHTEAIIRILKMFSSMILLFNNSTSFLLVVIRETRGSKREGRR